MQVPINWVLLGSVAALVSACSPQPPTIMKALPAAASEAWAPQDVATNVQDWDRAAKRIADGLEDHGMLAVSYTHLTLPTNREV